MIVWSCQGAIHSPLASSCATAEMPLLARPTANRALAAIFLLSPDRSLVCCTRTCSVRYLLVELGWERRSRTASAWKQSHEQGAIGCWRDAQVAHRSFQWVVTPDTAVHRTRQYRTGHRYHITLRGEGTRIQAVQPRTPDPSPASQAPSCTSQADGRAAGQVLAALLLASDWTGLTGLHHNSLYIGPSYVLAPVLVHVLCCSLLLSSFFSSTSSPSPLA